MITEVSHEVDARGYYSGYFEAIAADTGFIPRPEFKMPKSEAQVAKVISNTDPLNRDEYKSSSIGRREVILQTGSSNDTRCGRKRQSKQNRGFMSIPEVGDR